MRKRPSSGATAAGPCQECLRLDTRAVWLPSPDPTPPALVVAIGPFLPIGSVLYIEGTRFSPEAQALFLRHTCRPTRCIAPDTLQPKPRTFHLPATPAVLSELASFMRHNPSAVWGHHIKFYDSSGILVDWHDADSGWFLLLSSRFSANAVSALGRELGCEFRLEHFGA